VKKVICALVLSLLIGVNGFAPARASSPKVGGNCSKLGQVTLSNNLSYTCIRSGKKLIWGKSVERASTSSTPVPTLSASPTATLPYDSSRPEEMQKCVPGSPWVIGYAHASSTLLYLSCGPDGYLHPQDGAPAINQMTGEPDTPASSDNSDKPCDYSIQDAKIATLSSVDETYGKILEQSWSQIDSIPLQQSGRSITLAIDPTYNKCDIEALTTAAKLISEKFGNLIPANFQAYAILSATTDFEKSAFANSPFSLAQWTRISDPGFGQVMDSCHNSGQGCGYIGFSPSDGTEMVWDFQSFSGTPAPASCALSNGSGEFFHEVQNYLSGGKAQRTGGWPFWLYEGQIGAIGDVLDHPNLTSWVEMVTALKDCEAEGSGTTDLSVMENNDANGKNTGTDDSTFYNRGTDASVYLLGVYGWDKVLKFMQDSKIEDWKIAFQGAFGISTSDFYAQVTPFLQWMNSERNA